MGKPVAPPKAYDGVPYTVTRLMALKPGETVRYYRGAADDLDRDQTPLHNAVLHQVFATAARLEKQGRAKLQEVPFDLKTEMSRRDGKTTVITIALTDYTATGLA